MHSIRKPSRFATPITSYYLKGSKVTCSLTQFEPFFREFAAKRARVGEAHTERGSTAWEPEPGRRIKGGTRPMKWSAATCDNFYR